MGIGKNEFSCCCLGAKIVEIVLQIYVGKVEVGIPARDMLLAPVDSLLHDIKPLETPFGCQVSGHSHSQTTDAATYIEHGSVRLEVGAADDSIALL